VAKTRTLLPRYALMAQGERVHICTWPAVWPTVSQDGGEISARRAHYDETVANRIELWRIASRTNVLVV
jgi:hypothetical protein